MKIIGNLAIVAMSGIMLSGCVTWTKAGVQDYQMQHDLAQCRNEARSAHPKQAMPEAPKTTYHTGVVYTDDGPVNYELESTTAPDPAAISISIGNLGAVLRQNDYVDSCMMNKGYRQQKA